MLGSREPVLVGVLPAAGQYPTLPVDRCRQIRVPQSDKSVELNFEQNVRQAAYLLWEKDGRPFGSEKEYWFRALEAQLAARDKAKGHEKPAND